MEEQEVLRLFGLFTGLSEEEAAEIFQKKERAREIRRMKRHKEAAGDE